VSAVTERLIGRFATGAEIITIPGFEIDDDGFSGSDSWFAHDVGLLTADGRWEEKSAAGIGRALGKVESRNGTRSDDFGLLLWRFGVLA